MEAQIQLLQEQQKLLKVEKEVQPEKEDAKETKVSQEPKPEKMETSFPDPTCEQIKELLEEPKDIDIKKTE